MSRTLEQAAAYWLWDEEDITITPPVTKRSSDLMVEFGKNNPCHVPSGPQGGQFCSTGKKVAGGRFLAGSAMGILYQSLEDGGYKNKHELHAMLLAKGVKNPAERIATLKAIGAKNGNWDVYVSGGQVRMVTKLPPGSSKPPAAPPAAAPKQQPTIYSSVTTPKPSAVQQALENAKPGVQPIDWVLDNKAALENLNVSSNKFYSKLNANEKDALGHYTSYGYKELNTKLRTGAVIHDEKVVHLTTAVSKGGFDKEVVVYRGIPATVGKELKPGQVFVDNGFISTSISKDKAKQFTGSNVARIRVSPGQPVGPVGPHSSHSSEMEVILPRGSMFKVESVTKETIGYTEVFVTDLTLL